jgi:Lysophospholipase L1 and related esterases
LNFFESLGRKVSGLATNPPVNIVFLGDSITHGSFEIYMDKDGSIAGVYDHDSVYHTRLKQMINTVFPSIPINIINSGIGGETAEQGLKRLERDVLSYTPTLVVVCFGLNDAMRGKEGAGSYQESLDRIFCRLKDNCIETIFMTPNMMNTYISPLLKKDFVAIAKTAEECQNGGTLDYYMKQAGIVCKDNGIIVCDCYQKWKALFESRADTTSLLCNYINHPSREMHRLFASSLFDTLLGA